MPLYPSKFEGLWLGIKDETTFGTIEEFCNRHSNTVFINDLLALSVALDMNFEDNYAYTHIGQLEKNCKDHHDPESLARLADAAKHFLENTPFYMDTSVIAAVPPRPGKQYDLPTNLVKELAKRYRCDDISASLEWKNEKPSLKSLNIAEKWSSLESAELRCEYDLQGANVVLIDDMYQSGTTIHYVASKLLGAGANKVFGLCLVKSWRDTDNV